MIWERQLACGNRWSSNCFLSIVPATRSPVSISAKGERPSLDNQSLSWPIWPSHPTPFHVVSYQRTRGFLSVRGDAATGRFVLSYREIQSPRVPGNSPFSLSDSLPQSLKLLPMPSKLENVTAWVQPGPEPWPWGCRTAIRLQLRWSINGSSTTAEVSNLQLLALPRMRLYSFYPSYQRIWRFFRTRGL